ncbi:MAG: response regulator [Myxococcales bacterium FL481]|nr:MAG: response regulator [Myxococcales bacterium FL481]
MPASRRARGGSVRTGPARLRDAIERWSERNSEAATSLERSRRFLVTAYAFALSIIGPLSGACYWLLEAEWLSAWSILLGLVSAACYYAIGQGLATATAARAMTVTFWSAFAFLLWGGGGTKSPMTTLLILIPISAGLLGGTKTAMRWGVASITLVVGLGTAEHLDALPDPFALERQDTPEMRAAMVTFLLMLMLGVALVQEVIHARSRRDADEARLVAETANELKTHFLLNVSHELLTPLNGVLGLCELLEHTDLDEEQADYLRGVRKSGERLLLLIKDLLDFAELETGQARVLNEPVDPTSLIEQVVKDHSAMAEVKHLELKHQPAATRVSLYGDPGRIRRCLAILVDNALKFTDHGEIEVSFAFHEEAARWSVRDTGKGIGRDQRSQIFDRFRQLHGGPSRTAGGLGLGLAYFASLVELLDGSFGLESVEGEGSTFWFEVPARHAPQKPSDGETATVGDTAGDDRPRVLVAEDDAIGRTTISRRLKKMGCEVVSVIHGRDALEALARAEFDVVLMDCEMPVMDGFQATRAIRERRSKGELPIVAVTAHGATRNRARCLEAGMNDFVTKPVSRDQLARILRSWTKHVPRA